VQSNEGIGKTVIATIIRNHLFGKDNSSTVDGAVVLGEQTSWAANKVLVVLEEIKVSGHNRYETVNRLKTLITNDSFSYVEKYEVTRPVPNYANFIAFTNHKDALPVTDTDRRWWIVYSPIRDKNEFLTSEVTTLEQYFAPLYALKDNASHGAQLLKWLMDRELGSTFNPNFAPESMHKDRAIATEDAVVTGLSEIRDLITEGYGGIDEEVISTRELKKLLDSEDVHISDKHIGLLLRKLGYEKLDKKVFYKGLPHRLWTTLSGKNNREIRALFVESMENGNAIEMFDKLEDDDD
jgi:hypothetical protein